MVWFPPGRTGPVTLNANGDLTVTGATGVGNSGTSAALVVNVKTSSTNFSPEFTNSGTMLLTSPAGGATNTTLAINPTTGANPTFDNAGVLTVGTGGALTDDENNVNPVNGVFLNAGTLSFLGDGATQVLTLGNFDDGVQNTGSIVVNGGGSLDPSLTFVDFLGTLSGSGSVQLRDGTMFEAGGDTGGTVQFAGDQGVIVVDEATPEPTSFSAILDGFGYTDIVRYTQPISSMHYAGSTSSGVLTVHFSGGGTQELAFANIPSVDFTHNAISVSDDEVVIACFAAGTRILTDAGERAVERLRVGDRVVTLLGGRLAHVRWIGCGTFARRGLCRCASPRTRSARTCRSATCCCRRIMRCGWTACCCRCGTSRTARRWRDTMWRRSFTTTLNSIGTRCCSRTGCSARATSIPATARRSPAARIGGQRIGSRGSEKPSDPCFLTPANPRWPCPAPPGTRPSPSSVRSRDRRRRRCWSGRCRSCRGIPSPER